MLWITKQLVDRLVGKFALNLTQLRHSLFTLSPVVVPVTDVDRLLRLFRHIAVTGVATTGTGLLAIATVDTGKRWRIIGAVIHDVGGNWTHDGLYIGKTATAPTCILLSSYTATGAANQNVTPATIGGSEIWMEPGWYLYINVAAFVTTGTASIDLYIEEEDAY